jgi:hypothetical protein
VCHWAPVRWLVRRGMVDGSEEGVGLGGGFLGFFAAWDYRLG